MPKRWLIFGIACSLFFLSQFYRVSNAVIAPELLSDLSLDTRGLGLISASFFYAFALTQIPIGLLLDKVGPRSMMTTLSAVGIFGAIIFSWADSMALGVTGRVLMGVGMACNLMGTYKLLTLWFSPRAFATLAGLVVALGTAGNMVATTPLVILVDQIGWRSSFQFIAVINLILVFLFFVIVRDRPPQNNPDASAGYLNSQHAFGNMLRTFNAKRFLDNLVCHLCPLRHLCRLSSPLGRPVFDGSYGVFRPDYRQSHFTSKCRHDTGRPLLGYGLRQVI